MPTKRPTSKSTKADILAAYNELAKEQKSLAAQLAAAQKNAFTSPNIPATSPQKIAQEKTTATAKASMKQANIEFIIEQLNTLQLNFGGAASTLSEQLTTEALQLQAIQESVAEELEQLNALHGLAVEDNSLDTLIEEYEANSKTFEEEFNQQEEELELALAQTEKTWTNEQQDHHRAIQERNENRTKLCQRDNKEYRYDLNLARKLSDEDYEQIQKQRYQEIDDTQEAQEKLWEEREKSIAEREAEFQELETQVEGFPEELEKETKKAKEEGKGIAHHQAKVKADLVAKEVEGQKRTYELRIGSLQDTIESQQDRIQSLSEQLDAALKQVQDLAVKAIEGASNLNSLKSIREIAIEQAKNPSKSK